MSYSVSAGADGKSSSDDTENEGYRILYTLTAMVADCAEEMEENIQMIEKLDYIFQRES